MATETELERMVVRLIGDAESYQKMLKDSVAATEKSVRDIQTSIGQFDVATVALGTLAADAIKKAGSYVLQIGKQVLQSYTDQEDAIVTTEAALAANGRAVQTLSKDYQDFASLLQDITVIGDEVTLSMLQQAEAYGITGEAAKRAVKNAIGLATVRGGSPENYIRITAGLEQGYTEMLGRLLPSLRLIDDDSKRAAAAQSLLAKMFDISTARAKSFSGQSAQLNNAIDDFNEGIGEVIAGSLLPFVATLKDVFKFLKGLPPELILAGVATGGLVVAIAAAIPLFNTFIIFLEKIALTRKYFADRRAAQAAQVAAADKVEAASSGTMAAEVTAAYGTMATASAAATAKMIADLVALAEAQAYYASTVAMASMGSLLGGPAGAAPLLLTGPSVGKIIDVKVIQNATTSASLLSRTLGTVTSSVTKLGQAFAGLNVATRAGIYLMAAYVAVKLTMWLAGGNKALEDFNKEMERSNKLLDARTQKLAKQTSEMQFVNPQDQKETEKQLKDYETTIHAYRKELEGLGSWNPMTNLVTGNKQLELTEANLKDVEALAAAASKKLERMREILAAQAPDALVKEALKDLKKFNDEAQIKVETFGLTEAEAAVYRFTKALKDSGKAMLPDQRAEIQRGLQLAQTMIWQDQAKAIDEVIKKSEEEAKTATWTANQVTAYAGDMKNATKAQQEYVYTILDTAEQQKKAAEDSKQLQQSVKDLTENLWEQVYTFTMTAEEASVYKLQLKGISEQQLASARQAAQIIKAQEEFKKLQEEAKKVTEQAATPLEKLITKQSELANMLNNNVISIDVYKKSLKEAEQQAHKDYTAEFKTEGIDAVAADTAEFVKEFQKYRLGIMPIPGAVVQPEKARERTFTWEGEDTTTGISAERQLERLELGNKAAPLLQELVSLAKQYWTNKEEFILTNLGLSD